MEQCNLIANITATPKLEAGIYIIQINFTNKTSVGKNDKFFLDRWEVFDGDVEMLEDILVEQVVPYYMAEDIHMDEALIYMAEGIKKGKDWDSSLGSHVNFKRVDITEQIRAGSSEIVDNDIDEDALYIYRLAYYLDGRWCGSEIIMARKATAINSYGLGEDSPVPITLHRLVYNNTNVGLVNPAIKNTEIIGRRPHAAIRLNHRYRGTIESCKFNQQMLEVEKHMILINNINRMGATKLQECINTILAIRDEEFAQWVS